MKFDYTNRDDELMTQCTVGLYTYVCHWDRGFLVCWCCLVSIIGSDDSDQSNDDDELWMYKILGNFQTGFTL